ncbi:early endosome antigen 1-like [Dendronephthya gigantea]|uniref:early endosome antigen 1-like n=1 Tax=Dendronephthya gigantea TaxID=151771 RepID=UPI00106A8DEB|nr:early endosome antigen 1-like [Dendronephthya gigantea]
MAENSEANDLVVKPQQLIGGINGLILQMHKYQVELDESKQRQLEQAKRIKTLEEKNEEYKNDINELTKTKERLTEQSGFLQKSLDKKKVENNEILERLKQAEIKLGESGSVLATVRSLESKNELLSEKMSNVLLNTEEENAKAKEERGHYTKLLEETAELNKRNLEIQTELSNARQTGDENTKQSKAFVERSEQLCSEIFKTLDEVFRAKQQFTEFNSDRVKNCLKENASLQKENKDLKEKANALEVKLHEEQQRANEVSKEKLLKIEGEKQELLKEVHFLQKKIQEKVAKSNAEALENEKKNKQYEALQEQLKMLAQSYSEATQQLGQLKESVDESKDMLKANIEKGENAEEDAENSGHEKIDQGYIAMAIEMQGIFQQSDIRDEELASLESIAGIQGQRFSNGENSEGSSMASCIRGLVAIKDSQIATLTRERDELSSEIAEKKKNEYRHLYHLNELQKENDEILAKMEACQAKYRKLKEDKEDIRQSLLVKSAADKITHSYINKLKHENEQHKANLEKHEQELKQKFQRVKDELEEKMEAKNVLVQTMQEKIAIYQRERETLKCELNSRQKKDNAIKEQIISIFES